MKKKRKTGTKRALKLHKRLHGHIKYKLANGEVWSLLTTGFVVLVALVGATWFGAPPLLRLSKNIITTTVASFTDETQAAKDKLAAHKIATPKPTPPQTVVPSTPLKGASLGKNKGAGQVVAATAPQGSNHFTTLPPGSALPSDEACAAKVRPALETRPANKTANQTKGTGGNTEFSRVTGNFSGTTDEILQWAACKWGVDEDVARAQAVKESWWFNRTMGDWTTDPNLCWWDYKTLGAYGTPGQCPESLGILQVRYINHSSGLGAYNNSPYRSTAYNADYTYAVWRDCYEGNMTWLNTVERGEDYKAGDVWGCVGEWYSGRWLTLDTYTYINAIKGYLNQRIWETEDFITAQ